MKTRPLALAIALAIALTPLVARAEGASADALLRRYDEVMAPGDFEAVTRMVAHRDDGSTRTYQMTLLKSGEDKLRATFSAPASAKGQELLRSGDNLWLYMPNLKRAVRVASRDSFMGGDFNNADVLRVNYVADYAPSLVETTDTAYALELKAKGPEVAYDKIKLWMSKDDASQPQRAEYYAKSGKLLRSAEFSDVKDFGQGFVRPARMVMKNEVSKARWSEMVWESVTLKDSIPSQRFVLDDLGR